MQEKEWDKKKVNPFLLFLRKKNKTEGGEGDLVSSEPEEFVLDNIGGVGERGIGDYTPRTGVLVKKKTPRKCSKGEEKGTSSAMGVSFRAESPEGGGGRVQRLETGPRRKKKGRTEREGGSETCQRSSAGKERISKSLRGGTGPCRGPNDVLLQKERGRGTLLPLEGGALLWSQKSLGS